MGISIIVDSIKIIEGVSPYTREVTTLFDLWRNGHASTILDWFEDHLDVEHISMGPYYEFDQCIMDELVKDCKAALENKGPFAGKEGMPEQDCKDIIETVTRFKDKNKDIWDRLILFQVSAG